MPYHFTFIHYFCLLKRIITHSLTFLCYPSLARSAHYPLNKTSVHTSQTQESYTTRETKPGTSLTHDTNNLTMNSSKLKPFMDKISIIFTPLHLIVESNPTIIQPSTNHKYNDRPSAYCFHTFREGSTS